MIKLNKIIYFLILICFLVIMIHNYESHDLSRDL